MAGGLPGLLILGFVLQQDKKKIKGQEKKKKSSAWNSACLFFLLKSGNFNRIKLKLPAEMCVLLKTPSNKDAKSSK